MTTPSGVIPSGAANYDGLADFAAKTELDWNVEIKNGQLSTWGEGGLLGHLFQDLSRGKPLVIAILGSLADALGLGGVFDTVESVVSAIAGFLNRAFEELWEFILDIPIIGDIVQFVADILGDVVDMFVTLFTNPLGAVAELWDAFKTFIDNLWDGIVDVFVTLFTNPGELLDRLGDAWRGVTGWISGELDDVWEWLLGVPLIGDVLGWIEEKAQEILGWFITLFRNPGAAISELWSAFKAFLDNLWDGIVDEFVSLFTNPGAYLGRLGDAFVDFLKDIPLVGDVVEWIDDALGTVFGWFEKLANALGLNKIWSTIDGLVGDIGGFINTGIDWAKEAFRTVAGWLGLDHVIDTVGGVVNWVGGFISDIAGSVWAGLNGAATWVGKAVSTGLDAVFNAVRRLFDKADTTDRNAAQMMARLATPGVGGGWQVVSATDEVSFPHTLVNTKYNASALPIELTVRDSMVTIVTVRSDRTFNAVRVAPAKALAPGNPFFVSLYRLGDVPKLVQPSGFGAAFRAYETQLLCDLGDQSPAMSGTGQVKTLLLPRRISVSAGDRIGIAIRQYQMTTPLLMHCVSRNEFPDALTLFGVRDLMRHPEFTDIPVPNPNAPLVVAAERAPVNMAGITPFFVEMPTASVWCAIADVDESKPQPRAFADNFNRAGSNTLGPAWLARRGQLGVRQWDFGWFTPKRTSAVSLSGSSVSTQISRMATKDHEVFGVPYSTASGASSQSYLLARFDGLGNGVAAMLGFWSGRYHVEIRQCTADYDPRNGVVRASGQVTDYMDFTMFKILCDGTRYSIWYVDRNGNPKEACSWNDTSGLLTVSDANTETGCGAYQTGMNSAIDDWAAKDLIK